ncbi:MAG: TIGR02677 family protein [Chloroflexi bacterium]|nr:MAG: TIGR02677 family protein [Chloroflexota bacterium]
MNDTMQHNYGNIDINNGNSMAGSPVSQAAGIVTSSEPISSASVFNFTDRLPIFSYLVSSNRIRWYRVIMRFFLQCHRELYRYQLTAQEVRDALRETFDSEYTLEQCQNDLAALKEWGNITTIYDSSRATSIASFLSPALLYQATPEAIAIETFLDEQARANTGKGSLRQGDLPHLWKSLQTLDEALRSLPTELTPTRGREMAEEWQRAFEIWNAMAREAAQYLANMISAAQQTRPELDAYQLYKAAVVAYVHGFAQALTQYSRRIRTQLAEWNESGKKEQLIEIVAQYLEPPAPTLENRSSRQELLQEARNQVDALMHWFALGKNADSFRRNALAEVDKVVRRASVLAASARPNANYAANLHMLAHQLYAAKDGETAQQLFSLAFANLLPVHLPESFAGAPSAAHDTETGSAWQEPPSVNLRLRPISRFNRSEHALEDPVIDNRALTRSLMRQYEEKLKEEQQRFARLFSTTDLDLATFKQITAEERAILLTVIDSCLGDARGQYRAPDGSTIVLLNPDEQTYTALRAPDGVLLLPCYHLQREELQGRSA